MEENITEEDQNGTIPKQESDQNISKERQAPMDSKSSLSQSSGDKMSIDAKRNTQECDICLEIGEHASASMYCKTEEMRLCDRCGKVHKVQRSTKDHIVIPMSELSTPTQMCELCASQGEDVEGYGFCEDCDDPEILCYSCSRRHTASKNFQSHKISQNMKNYFIEKGKQSKLSAESTLMVKVSPIHQFPSKSECQEDESSFLKRQHNYQCSICQTENTVIQAERICVTCNEKLCDECFNFHSLQSLTRNHRTIPFSKLIRKKCLCTICESPACFYCKDCNENLCERCKMRHNLQSAARTHDVVDILTRSLEEYEKENVVCEPCKMASKEEMATSFCSTCEEPEPMCDNCATRHTKPKITRDHEICRDIRLLPEKKSEMSEISCVQCSKEKRKIAIAFCEDCDKPEPLCEECSLRHKKHKSTRSHRLCYDIKKWSTVKQKLQESIPLCEPCKVTNEKNQATSFCYTCDEHLCINCTSDHQQQKETREHKISNEIQAKSSQKERLCIPCSFVEDENLAVCFCESCEEPEPMCKTCGEEHICQTDNRKHKLCYDIEKLSQESFKMDCHNCMNRKQNVPATSFCLDCKIKIPMCDRCSNFHRKDKSSRGHSISNDLKQLFSLLKSTEKDTSNSVECSKIFGERKESENKVPGKPHLLKSQSDSIILHWALPSYRYQYFEVKYRCSNTSEKWKSLETENSKNETTVSGLKADTEYEFQVRGKKEDEEGPFSDKSNPLKTKKSLATNLLNFSTRLDENEPSKWQLNTTEVENARNEQNKTRKLFLGNDSLNCAEKTIMLVGATGSGKSTLVDGIINYIMGVSFDDPYRFTLVQLEASEKKTENQAISQTEWITVYRVAPQEGSRLPYTINIIDTPGFGDTRGIQRDHTIVDQIRNLFSATGEAGVMFLDAVCFIVKAPDARLTVTQRYIFNSIMALFGKDIESNICSLITFADGGKPPVLASLKEANLPFGEWFPFNSSALFSGNTNLPKSSLSPIFYEMGCKSFENFFTQLAKFETRSLTQTKTVLEKRKHLQTVIENLHPQVNAGLSKLAEMKKQLEIFEKHKSDIEDNKDFTYKTNETRQVKIELERGKYVTNCLLCHITCHDDCGIRDDENKARCIAMDWSGHCSVCSHHCIWSEHKNTPYIFKYITVEVEKTYSEMKTRYETAVGETLTHEKYLEKLSDDMDYLFENVTHMINESNKCENILKEIALRQDPLSAVEHIDLMIENEKLEKQEGFIDRIKMLEEFKQKSQINIKVDTLANDFKKVRENVSSAMGKSDDNRKEKKGNPAQRFGKFLTSLF